MCKYYLWCPCACVCQIPLSFRLTITGLDALGPRVIKLQVPGLSTVLEPSTVGAATTAFAKEIGVALRTFCADGLGDGRQRAYRC